MLERSKTYIVVPDELFSDNFAADVGYLLQRCEQVTTETVAEAQVFIGLGDPTEWPDLGTSPVDLVNAYVWIESFLSQDAYRTAVEKIPHATFLHGREGIQELIRILEQQGIIDVETPTDPLAEDAFFRLKGDYLHQLDQEIEAMTASPSNLETAGRVLLERVAGSAGTYEFDDLSNAAMTALAEVGDGPLAPDTVEAVLRTLGEALEEELERYNQRVETLLPALIELDVRQRVLVLADDPLLANQMKFALSHSRMQTVLHPDPAEILDALHAIQPDLLLVQSVMGHFDGLDLASYIRTIKRFEALPIVALMNDMSEAAVSRAIRCGVDAWLSIPVSAANVALSVLNQLRRVETARKLGGRDGLTGLYTKEAMLDRLQGDISRVSRAGQQIAVVLVRITSTSSPRLDFLEIANSAKRVFRRSDLIARYNEATLAVVLPGIDARSIVAVLSRFRKVIGDSIPFEIAATLADGSVSPEGLLADVEIRLSQVLGGKTEAAVGLIQKDEEAEAKARVVPRILIADTDEAIVNLLRFFCAREGFEVSDVRNGTDTLAFLEQAETEGRLPDVLVMETFLPGIDGFQILEKVQTDFGHRVAVIMLSVRPSEERVSKAFQMGATDFVAKPFKVPEVIARIRNGLIRTSAV